MPSITQVQPPLEFIPPQFDPIVYQVARQILPLWMRWSLRITDVHVDHIDRLVDLYQRFQTGQSRILLAFRHPSTTDPFCMSYLLSQALPKAAKQRGIALASPLHAHFMYDRGIPLWAGQPVGWLFSRLGCTPIRRGKLDTIGLRSARQLFTDGAFPLAAAPEGATNGHNEILSPLEPGIAQLCFWCLEDLQKAGRAEQVLVVPIGLQYRYIHLPWPALERILDRLEQDAGLSPYSADELAYLMTQMAASTSAIAASVRAMDQAQLRRYGRLIRLADYLLSLLEDFYRRFYHQPLPPVTAPLSSESTLDLASGDLASGDLASGDSAAPHLNQKIAQRMRTLLHTALLVAEQHFGLQAKGDLSDRCRRLEQAAWDRIYREDLRDLETLPPAERGLADRVAEEADLRLWHMRLVESFVSVTGQYVIEKPTIERFAETVLLIWRTMSRITGRSTPDPNLGAQQAYVTVGMPISVSDRRENYKTNRRQAVAALTQDLQTALEQMIH